MSVVEQVKFINKVSMQVFQQEQYLKHYKIIYDGEIDAKNKFISSYKAVADNAINTINNKSQNIIIKSQILGSLCHSLFFTEETYRSEEQSKLNDISNSKFKTNKQIWESIYSWIKQNEDLIWSFNEKSQSLIIKKTLRFLNDISHDDEIIKAANEAFSKEALESMNNKELIKTIDYFISYLTRENDTSEINQNPNLANLLENQTLKKTETNFLQIVKKEVQDRFNNGNIALNEYFDFLQFSYFTHKISQINLSVCLFDLLDPKNLSFLYESISQMSINQLTSLLFVYGKWISQNSRYSQDIPVDLLRSIYIQMNEISEFNSTIASHVVQNIGTTNYYDEYTLSMISKWREELKTLNFSNETLNKDKDYMFLSAIAKLLSHWVNFQFHKSEDYDDLLDIISSFFYEETLYNLSMTQKLILLSSVYRDLWIIGDYDHKLWGLIKFYQDDLNNSNSKIVLNNVKIIDRFLSAERNFSLIHADRTDIHSMPEFKYLGQFIKPQIHKSIVEVLEGCEFHQNHLDKVHIDYAVINSCVIIKNKKYHFNKLAIMVPSPAEYLFPRKELSQRTLANYRWLEKTGWKVLVVPYNKHKVSEYLKKEIFLQCNEDI